MKIIIMSAGKGTRMMPLTKNTPKPLLRLENGNTLIEEEIQRMESSGMIDEVIFVIGYLAEQIEDQLADYDGPMRISTVFNPFYDMSNNLLSLWLAKHEMTEDFLITNGDNIFDPSVFTALLGSSRNGIHLTTSRRASYDDDDMKVSLANGNVVRVHKEIPEEDADAESVGLVLVSGQDHIAMFTQALERLARQREYLNRFWLEIFNSLAADGYPVIPFEIDGGALWQEFDFHWDIEKARRLIGISPK